MKDGLEPEPEPADLHPIKPFHALTQHGDALPVVRSKFGVIEDTQRGSLKAKVVYYYRQ